MDKLSYTISPMEGDRLRIVITLRDQELGSLYYEKAKRTFQRKPISMGSWACVDAKIEGLYEAGIDITPTEVMVQCQQEIRMAGY
jgi:hypothetical protein